MAVNFFSSKDSEETRTMYSPSNNIEYRHEEKFMKVPFIIYADLESLLKKINTCHHNSEKSQ